MIDPRFATAGAVPFAVGYGGARQMPFQQHYHHRHHHHHHNKSKNNVASDSPISRDESIHKVDYGRHNIQQNDGAPFSGGYGVPYGAGGYSTAAGGYSTGVGGFTTGASGGFYPQVQQPQYFGGNYGFTNQYQGNVYNQGQYTSGPEAPIVKHHRHRHRRHRSNPEETVTGAGVTEQPQGVPEQLIGQRSSSVLNDEAAQAQSVEGEASGEQTGKRRHRHRRHHRQQQQQQQQQQSNEQFSFHQGAQSHSSVGADGYGHINEDLIFIERGDHSPHRQEPPPGYEYKGKIEVQNTEKVTRSYSQGQAQTGVTYPSVQPQVPVQQPTGPCPPGWTQVVLQAAPGGPPGTAVYPGQFGAGVAQAGIGGLSGFNHAASGVGFGGAGPIGAAGSGAGLANLAASLPFPAQGQLIADYIVESNAGGGVASAGGSGFANTNYQQTSGGSFTNQVQTSHTEASVTARPTVIEVWQKRSKSEIFESKGGSTRSPRRRSSFDFNRFRADILNAIERMGQNGGKIQWTGHDGGTQTQITPSVDVRGKTEVERRTTGGEVRVVVQPIQPVFYMPRQGETSTTATTTTAQTSFFPSGPAPAVQQTSGGSNVVYVPRNVYVPVIKPVFVPRERVIVRPQVIHVARPVLVDRPVPVTQRPIIIDRERPVPVSTRCDGQGVTQTTSSHNIQQEFAYQNANLPGSYAEQSGEYANTANFEYTPSHHEQQQYTTTSTHEVTGEFQTQEPGFNINCDEQYQQSDSASHLNLGQSGGSFHESYSNFAQAESGSAIHVASTACSGPIDVLDATVNPTWQRTDRTSLVQRYGRPAQDIVQRTDQVEQQMYQELRQRTSSGGIQRSTSGASYGSGLGVGGTVNYNVTSSSFTTNTIDDFQNFNSGNIDQQR